MREFLERQIAEHEAQLTALRRQLDEIDRKTRTIDGALMAYRKTLAHLPHDDPGDRPRPSRSPPAEGRSRAISEQWKALLLYIAGVWPGAVRNDDILGHAETAGIKISRESLRSQLSTYTNRGFLERVEQGVYRITELGAREIEFALPSAERALGPEPPPPEGPPPGPGPGDTPHF